MSSTAILTCAERERDNQAGYEKWEYDFLQALGFYYEGSIGPGDHLGTLVRSALGTGTAVFRELDAKLRNARAVGVALRQASDVQLCVAMATNAGIPVRPGAGGLAYSGAVRLELLNQLTAEDVNALQRLRNLARSRSGGDTSRLIDALEQVHVPPTKLPLQFDR